MNPEGIIDVWRPPDIAAVELRKGEGVAIPIPRHWHEEFQFCLIEMGDGQVNYRGANHRTPAASLNVIHPGEVHSNESFVPEGCSYRSIYVEPDRIRGPATEVFGKAHDVPYFPAPVIYDHSLLEKFSRLFEVFENAASTLERESRLQAVCVDLITRFGERRPELLPFRRDPRRVRAARDFLDEHYAENISLRQLSRVAGISEFHFSRMFAAEVGMPPHAYQTQLRVTHARKLLRRGIPASQVAACAGFADQSHFTRQFKRLVGVTPGRYQQNSKNVQDISTEVA